MDQIDEPNLKAEKHIRETSFLIRQVRNKFKLV